MKINLYGGPCVGKSATASMLFYELKIRNIKVELVNEYIKDWAWQGIIPASWDQFYVFAKQIHKEDIVLRNAGARIVTDSPVPMQLAYMKRSKSVFYEVCLQAAKLWEKTFPSKHILLKRTVPYQKEGRYEDLEQACFMDRLIKEVLEKDFGTSFIELDPVADFEKILNVVLETF